MNSRQLPPVRDVFAYWTASGAVLVTLHGEDYKDVRAATLTPAQALKLAEQLVRAAREAIGA